MLSKMRRFLRSKQHEENVKIKIELYQKCAEILKKEGYEIKTENNSEYEIYLKELLNKVHTVGIKVEAEPEYIKFLGVCYDGNIEAKLLTVYKVYECEDGIKYISIPQ